MAKVDLITKSGITASDGSVVESGATLKFDSNFFAASTLIKITPKLYRNRELFESGYREIFISEQVLPVDFVITLSEEAYYQLTPLQLYEEVKIFLNNLFGREMFEIKIIS